MSPFTRGEEIIYTPSERSKTFVPEVPRKVVYISSHPSSKFWFRVYDYELAKYVNVALSRLRKLNTLPEEAT